MMHFQRSSNPLSNGVPAAFQRCRKSRPTAFQRVASNTPHTPQRWNARLWAAGSNAYGPTPGLGTSRRSTAPNGLTPA